MGHANNATLTIAYMDGVLGIQVPSELYARNS